MTSTIEVVQTRIDQRIELFRILVEAYEGDTYAASNNLNRAWDKITENSFEDVVPALHSKVDMGDDYLHAS